MIDVVSTLAYYSKHSTCDRGRVACLILSEDKEDILECGYAHSLMTNELCDTHGHELKDGSCVRTIHAEQSAVARAACNGIRLYNGHAYVNKIPCKSCMRVLHEAGIQSVTAYTTTDHVSRLVSIVEYANILGIKFECHVV